MGLSTAVLLLTTSLLPPLPGAPNNGVVVCDGSLACVDGVIRDMTRRWRALDRGCDHDAVFALTYLLTTIGYREAVTDPDYFDDNRFVNNEDKHFAQFYFRAYDAWQSGNLAAVPPAWRTAFSAAENQSVRGLGNALLGMNAHINRDLPFVLYDIGLTAPDGSSRKPDHDRVNDILAAVGESVLREAADRYDPSIALADVPGTTLDSVAFSETIALWREAAWRNAERLRDASALTRPFVVARIEAEAAAMATTIALAFAYLPGETSAARDAHCADREPVADDCVVADLVCP